MDLPLNVSSILVEPQVLEHGWIIGVTFAVTSTVFAALGDNLIKLSFTRESLRVEGEPNTPLFCRPFWLLGVFSLVFIACTCTLISYTYADASLLIPFTGLHIVFNLIFAHKINHERISRSQIGFTVVILLGVTLVLCGGNHNTNSVTVSDISALFGGYGFIFMTAFVSITIVVLLLLSLYSKSVKVRCAATGMASGAIGAATQLFAKILSESLDQAFSGEKKLVFSDGVVYVGLVVTIVFSVAQFIVLNYALSKYKAYMVSPFVVSSLIILGSIYSAVFFEEWKRFELTSWILLPLGVFVAALGVVFLAYAAADVVSGEVEDRLSKDKATKFAQGPEEITEYKAKVITTTMV